MEWKDFFTLAVWQENEGVRRPYFHSILSVPELLAEEVRLSQFEHLGLTDQEKGRLTLGHRKILRSLHYFNSPEFERISENFLERVLREKNKELHFRTTAGGVYLFLALLKHAQSWPEPKTIICETTEVPVPVIRLPPTSTVGLRLKYCPDARSYLAGLPSLWAHPDVLRFFDKKEWAHVA